MQKTWDAHNRGAALRALLGSLVAVAIYLLILQISLAEIGPAFGDPIAAEGLCQAGTTPDDTKPAEYTPEKPAEKPAEDADVSINNAAIVDFLCPADLRGLLAQMYEYERNADWAETIKIYQQILSAANVGDCVPSEENPETLYVGVREYLNERIKKYPPEARNAYLARFSGDAQRMLSAAIRSTRLDLLQKVADDYILTESGLTALDMLAGYAQEHGDFMEAAYYLERIAEFFPEALAAQHLVKMVRCYAALNESQRVDESIARLEKDFAETEIVVAGKNVKALEYARELAGVGAAEEDDDAWPMAGGVDAGQSRAAVLGETGRSVWTQYLDVPNIHTDSKRYVAVRNDLVYVNSGREVTAYSLLSGRGPVWKFDLQSPLDAAQRDSSGKMQDSVTRQHAQPTAITIRGPRLYSSIFGVLFCLNIQTGKMLWMAEMPDYSGVSLNADVLRLFIAAPLLIGGNMYTCAVTQDLTADDTYTLYCHDALTGEMKWRRDFCQVSRIGSVRNTSVLAKVATAIAMPAILRQGRGMVYVSTNAGAVAAIDANSGEIAWVSRYDRGPGGNLSMLMENKWGYCLPVLARGRLFVTPQDSDRMYAFDLRTGRPLWSIDRKSADGDFAYLVGVDAVTGLVLLGGDKLVAYDMGRKKVLGPVNIGRVIGAGVLAGRDMMVPTSEGLVRVDIDGSLKENKFKTVTAAVWASTLPDQANFFKEADGCTLAVVDGVVVIESGRKLAVLYDADRRRDGLKAELAGATADADGVVRLKLAEVLQAQGDDDEALGQYRSALKVLRERAAGTEGFDEEAFFAYEGVAPSTLQYYGQQVLRARRGLSDTAYGAALKVLGQRPDTIQYDTVYRSDIPAAQDARILDYLKQAAEYATDNTDYVNVQLLLLARGKARQDWQGCVDLLVEMAHRPGRAHYEFSRYASASVVTETALFAAQQIDALLQERGSALYDKYDKAAQVLWNKAAASGKAEYYYEVALRYPNSLRAREALLEAMEKARGNGDYRGAVCFAQELLWRYREFAWRYGQDKVSAVGAMAYMAEGYAALGMHSEAERALAEMRATAIEANVVQVVVGGQTHKVAEFAAGVEQILAKTPRYDRPTLGENTLTVQRPIFSISDRYAGEYVLLRPQGCAPEGMENRIYMVQSTGLKNNAVVSCFENDTLALVWRRILPLDMDVPPDMADYQAGYSGNNLVLVHRSGIMGLDPADGSMHWKRYFSLVVPKDFKLGTQADPMSSKAENLQVRLGLNAIIADNAVYVNVPSNPTVMYAVNSRTGKGLWTANVGNAILAGMTLNGTRLYVPVLRDMKHVALVGVRRSDGAMMWRSKDFALIESTNNYQGQGGFSMGRSPMRRFSRYDVPIEVRDAGRAGVLVLTGEGLHLFKDAKEPVWTSQMENLDNVRFGDVDDIAGPKAETRLGVGEGWCAVIAEAYTQIRVYDLASGKLLQKIEIPPGWSLVDWKMDDERLHVFAYRTDADGEAAVSARCFEARSGRMLYENLFQTGSFQYRPLVTARHVVFVRGDSRAGSVTTARVYVYDKVTGKIAARPATIDEMNCEQTGQAIDMRGKILVKGRSKIVSVRIKSRGG